MLSGIITTIIHAIVMAILAYFLPMKKHMAISHLSPAELRNRFMADDFKMLGIGWMAIISCGVMVYLLLESLLWLNGYFHKDVLILIQPPRTGLFVCSAFSGMFFSIPLYLAIGKVRFKERWQDFLAYQDLKYRMDFRRAMVVLAYMVGIMSAVFTFLMLDSYTVFAEDEIRFNPTFGIGADTYTYGQVMAINDVAKLVAPNGNTVEDPHFVIHFDDGQTWVSRQNGFSNYKKDLAVAQLVAEKTHLPIRQLEFDSE